MRKRILAGNWKMHKTTQDLEGFLAPFMEASGFQKDSQVEVLLAPPFTLLAAAKEIATPHGIQIGAQNCHEAPEGAFTGEVSIPMLKDLSIDFALIGHSERRQYYGETNKAVASKVAACLQNNLRPILCVGESREERESGLTEKVLETQVGHVLEMVQDLGNMVIAYEPVWAIGTGLTATNEEAEKAHKFIRSLVAKKDAAKAASMPILYGGSAKPANIEGLLKQENVDGALVGGASLKPQDFGAMVASALKG